MVVAIAPKAIDKIQSNLEQRIGSKSFQLWFKNSARLSYDERRLCVQVPNDWVGGWIENNFTDHLQAAAKDATGLTPDLRVEINRGLFTVTGDTPGERRTRDTAARPARSIAGHRPTRKLRYYLSTFVVGSANQVAYSTIQAVTDQVTSRFTPLFVHGPCGLGKTHLLQGLCNALTEKHPTVAWRYVSGEEFTNQFIVAVKTGALDGFRRQYRAVDVLVIDDVHFLANKRATQEEFLCTYNAIDAAGKQVVMASDAHPRKIGQLNTSLVDRFISGMVVEIEPPDRETRAEIVRRRGKDLGVALSKPVVDRLADAMAGNVRELEGAILKLLAYSSLCNQPVSLHIAEQVIRECTRPRSSSLQASEIEKQVASYFGVKVADIRCSKRTRSIATARAVAMYLTRKHTPMSFPEIGKYMGNKNHSTVILACKKIEQSLGLDQEVSWNAGGGTQSARLGTVIADVESALGCAKA